LGDTGRAGETGTRTARTESNRKRGREIKMKIKNLDWKKTGMTREDMAVHYGGMSWNHNEFPEIASIRLEKEVRKAGGWKKVLAKAEKTWKQICKDEGKIHTSSL